MYWDSHVVLMADLLDRNKRVRTPIVFTFEPLENM